MSRNGHTGAFVFGLFVGGISSAVATLLLTPKSGDDLREQLTTRGQQLQERAKATAEDARRRAEVLRSQSQELIQTYAGAISADTDAHDVDEAIAVATAEGVESTTGEAAARVDASAQATAEQTGATGEEAVAAAAEAVEEAAREVKEGAESIDERAEETRRDR